MKKYIFAYIGATKEVQVNSPYKQKFLQGEKVMVTQEMADALRTHPEFREFEKDDAETTEKEKLFNMTHQGRETYIREKAEKIGWKEFQKWADQEFGVKDTSKDELIEEVLNKLREG